MLYPLAAFGDCDRNEPVAPPSYWYSGPCPHTREILRLPRTALAEAIARHLMGQLGTTAAYEQEGKMYGVLLVTTPTGEQAVLKAFSGLLNGHSTVAGWVPPIPGRAQVALAEAHTLERLAAIKAELIALQKLPERTTYAGLLQTYDDRLQAMADRHRERKQVRDRQRQTWQTSLSGDALVIALEALVRESQQDGIERRRLKRERDQALQPLAQAIAQADARLQVLKQQRKVLSRQLQTQMHAVYSLTNFAGETATLQELVPTGLPTGTGDCAAPKLLHYAATHQLTPLALAEFWWGPASDDKQPGQFYGACRDRCQPILGFLLSGLPPAPAPSLPLSVPLTVWYEDDALLVVEKPSGLLSVPGRTSALQDSVLSRLRCQLPPEDFLKAVHRLDKGTSGLLVLAKSAPVHRHLNQQFAQRQVQKQYEALLSRPLTTTVGRIELPLWRDPRDRPKQSVNWQHGKPSLTEFQVLTAGPTPRLRFIPHTGRTHQLRVHAAHRQGLNAPILGDTLYGCQVPAERLHLHAHTLQFTHPLTQELLSFTSPVPF